MSSELLRELIGMGEIDLPHTEMNLFFLLYMCIFRRVKTHEGICEVQG